MCSHGLLLTCVRICTTTLVHAIPHLDRITRTDATATRTRYVHLLSACGACGFCASSRLGARRPTSMYSQATPLRCRVGLWPTAVSQHTTLCASQTRRFETRWCRRDEEGISFVAGARIVDRVDDPAQLALHLVCCQDASLQVSASCTVDRPHCKRAAGVQRPQRTEGSMQCVGRMADVLPHVLWTVCTR